MDTLADSEDSLLLLVAVKPNTEQRRRGGLRSRIVRMCGQGRGRRDQSDSVRGGTGGHRRIIVVRELYRLILKGWSLVSLWHLSGYWNTTTPILVLYGDIYTGGGEKPSVLRKKLGASEADRLLFRLGLHFLLE